MLSYEIHSGVPRPVPVPELRIKAAVGIQEQLPITRSVACYPESGLTGIPIISTGDDRGARSADPVIHPPQRNEIRGTTEVHTDRVSINGTGSHIRFVGDDPEPEFVRCRRIVIVAVLPLPRNCARR